ncbi:MAG: triose-phosphate isomerase, partial [Nitrospirota bacterium]
MRRPAIVANWKMNKTVSETVDYAREFIKYIEKVDTQKVDVVIAPPFTVIKTVADLLAGKNI